MIDLKPDKWYTLKDAFDRGLSLASRFNRDVDFRIKHMFDCKAAFSGTKLNLDLDPQPNLNEDYPKSTYYPLLRIPKASGKPSQTPIVLAEFGEVVFFVYPVNPEDLVGDPRFLIDDYSTIGQDYRYKMLLRSPNGIFVSKGDTTYPNFEKDGEAIAFFAEWRPLDGKGDGKLLVPYRLRRLSGLEIMLAEKQ